MHFAKSRLESLNQDRDRTSSKATTARRGAGIDSRERGREKEEERGERFGEEEEEGSDV